MTDIKRVINLDLPEGQSAFLWGARKSGKSTYLRNRFPTSPYYDFLDSELYFRYLNSPFLLRQELQRLPQNERVSPVIMDEVQKIPILLNEVHWMIENMKPLSFILCGSSSRKLRVEGANLLGGRAWRYIFMPLVYPELSEFDLLHIFATGLLPAHYLRPAQSEKSIKAYINDYLVHEIQYEGSVRNLRAFSRFLEVMAYCHGEFINYANIARDCGVDAKTIRGYFEILQDMFLGSFVDPFSTTMGRHVMTAHPRFYFFDVGIANYLSHRKITELKGIDAGRAFEHYLFYELNAYKALKDLDYPIRYWRTRSGVEVDFILGSGIVAIESKMTQVVQQRDLQGLLSFKTECPEAKLYVVCLEPRPRVMTVEGVQIQVVPIKVFLEELWAGQVI